MIKWGHFPDKKTLMSEIIAKPAPVGKHQFVTRPAKARDRLPDERAQILVVEDSSTMRKRLRRALHDYYIVLEAEDGEHAWSILQNNRAIELVLTDIDMPNLDGFELLTRIRASNDPRIKALQVIVVTGADNTKAKQRAFLEGANDFVSKNTDKVELVARVHAHHKLARTILELEDSKRVLSEQAFTDPLTKLTNRRHFFEKCEHEFALMHRHNKNFSVMMIDIDHFKSINDRYGHQAGDYILVRSARVLEENLRQGDALARIGGEEFAVAAPYTSRLGAVVLAERLRKAIQKANFVYNNIRIPVTISLGLATLNRDPGNNVRELLGIADQRLYNAKMSGRNRVGLSTDDPDDSMVISGEIKAACTYLSEVLKMLERSDGHTLETHLPELMEQILPLHDVTNKLLKAHFFGHRVPIKPVPIKSTSKPRSAKS